MADSSKLIWETIGEECSNNHANNSLICWSGEYGDANWMILGSKNGNKIRIQASDFRYAVATCYLFLYLITSHEVHNYKRKGRGLLVKHGYHLLTGSSSYIGNTLIFYYQKQLSV